MVLNRNIWDYTSVVLVSLVLVFLGFYVEHLNYNEHKQELRLNFQNKLFEIRSDIEGNINSNAMLIKGLTVALSVEPEMSLERFTSLSTPLISENPQINNIAAAPNLVIKYMNPIKGNETAIGLDYRMNSEQFPVVKNVIETGKLHITGPVNLVQGGQGLIVRLPVFTKEPGLEIKLWGIVSSVINVENFFEAAGLYKETEMNISLQTIDVDQKNKIIFGDNIASDLEPIFAYINLPNGQWKISAVPIGGWEDNIKNLEVFRGGLFVIILFIIVTLVYLNKTLIRNKINKHSLQAIMDHSPAVIYVRNSSGEFTYVNERFEELFEIGQKNIIGNIEYSGIMNDIANQFIAKDNVVLEKRQMIKSEETLLYDGSEHQYISVKFPLIDSNNNMYGLCSISTDISENKRIEREQKERNKKIIKFNNELTNLINNIHFKNGNYEKFLPNFTKSVAAALNANRVSIWTFSENVMECINLWDLDSQSYSKGNSLARSEFPQYFKSLTNGRVLSSNDVLIDYRLVEFVDNYFRFNNIKSILNAPFYFAGNIVGVLCVEQTKVARQWKAEEENFVISVTDILNIVKESSNRKELESTLSRTSKLDSLGKLTGGIAHDFNNILGIIIGFSDLLKEPLHNNAELGGYVEHINKAASRGAKLTRQLLNFTRVDNLETTNVIINNVLQDEKHLLEKTLTPRIKLCMELSEDLWPVLIDINDFEDSLLNLSINSMHAINGSGTLTLKTINAILNEKEASILGIKQGEYCAFSVIDDGCGMDSVTKERVFEPFYSTKAGKGTGLGLSQVYAFVKRSHGTIKVDSTLNQGTTFTIYFPHVNKLYSQSKVPVNRKDNVELNLKKDKTILVVDDEAALAEFTCTILEQEGYKVLSAFNGVEALTILKSEHVDVLISDIIMPEMDGHELASIVKKKYPTIKVQLVTGFTDKENLAKSSVNESQTYLHKPFSSTALLQRVNELLK